MKIISGIANQLFSLNIELTKNLMFHNSPTDTFVYIGIITVICVINNPVEYQENSKRTDSKGYECVGKSIEICLRFSERGT